MEDLLYVCLDKEEDGKGEMEGFYQKGYASTSLLDMAPSPSLPYPV